MKAILSRDEIERASRFRFEDDRSRFIASRSILRQLLSLYLACEPESISLEYNTWGKLALAAKFAGSDIRFNLSHSHGVAAYAIARRREVGVDVKMLRPDFANEGIAERFFSRTEIESLRSLPREHQTRAFFVCWTRKEAYVKALGHGLSIDLGSFDVSLRPEERPALLRCVDAAHWSLEAFQPCDGYVGAIAVQGPVYLQACDGFR
jgi:4'-phosphopantetheinyl transferase